MVFKLLVIGGNPCIFVFHPSKSVASAFLNTFFAFVYLLLVHVEIPFRHFVQRSYTFSSTVRKTVEQYERPSCSLLLRKRKNERKKETRLNMVGLVADDLARSRFPPPASVFVLISRYITFLHQDKIVAGVFLNTCTILLKNGCINGLNVEIWRVGGSRFLRNVEGTSY